MQQLSSACSLLLQKIALSEEDIKATSPDGRLGIPPVFVAGRIAKPVAQRVGRKIGDGFSTVSNALFGRAVTPLPVQARYDNLLRQGTGNMTAPRLRSWEKLLRRNPGGPPIRSPFQEERRHQDDSDLNRLLSFQPQDALTDD